MPQRWKRLPFGAVRPRGWIKRQIQNDLAHGFAGCLDALTERASTDLWLNQIDSASDQVAWWDAETRGNWIWGLAMAALLVDDAAGREKVRAALDAWISSQGQDGYLGIYTDRSRYHHPPGEQGELWGQSRALLSLLTWSEFFGSAPEFEAALRAVEQTIAAHQSGAKFFLAGQNPHDGCGMAHGLCYTDVMQRMFERTGDARFLRFAGELYREFSAAAGLEAFRDLSAAQLETRRKFSGHAVHTVEHIRCLLVALSAGAVGPRALDSAIKKLQRFRLPNGAVQGDESLRGKSSPRIGYEYCTITELAMSLGELGRAWGGAAIFDWLETLVYSAGQGARLGDGKGIGYLTTDDQFSADARRTDAYSGKEPGRRYKISPTHEDVACCCNPNSVRLMPQFVADMWALAPDGFACCAFGPSELRAEFAGAPLSIVQETNYPFEDRVHFRVQKAAAGELTITIRKPQWSGEASLNGAAFETRGQWFVVRVDGAEAEFSVDLAPDIRREQYATGEVAILRGPHQFVQRIEPSFVPTKSYPVAGFCDFDVVPMAELPRPPDVSDLRFEGDRILTGDGGTLVPIGQTVLRRAGFLARG